MLHEVIMITSVSYILPYRHAIDWLSKRKKKPDRQREKSGSKPVSGPVPPTREKLGVRAAAVLRACRKWLATWVILHVLILLALVRGITSGGGIFAAELDKLQLVVMKKLPARTLTRIFGQLMSINLAPWARKPVNGPICAMYGLKLDDAKQTEIQQYPSMYDVFTRTLREETRPICPEHSLVSPADGTVMHVGKIVDGEVKQVKGVNYRLVDFLGNTPLQEDLETDNCSGYESDGFDLENKWGLPRNDSITHLFQRFPDLKPGRGNELYHLVIYLSFSDYHHFHSPTDWNVQIRRHIVGELLSVAPWVVRQVPDLFSLSERVLLGGYWEHGFFSMSAVGAYNVGSIEIDMDQELMTNSRKDENEKGEVYHGETYDRIFESEGVPVRKGDHVGFFHLGSTVVLVFEAPKSFEFRVKAGDRVKYGQPLGTSAAKMHSLEFYGE